MISTLEGSGAFRSRLGEMGFVQGQNVTCVLSAPLGNPIVYEILGSRVALRKHEAARIWVTTDTNTVTVGQPTEPKTVITSSDEQNLSIVYTPEGTVLQSSCLGKCTGGCPSCGHARNTNNTDITPEADELTLVLVGNPNCGKTSLFNAASGGHEQTGNYSGVTVRSVIGRMQFEGRKLRIIDLPGTYSLRAYSPEEAYVAHELEYGHIDAVINVLDATHLERNLLLTFQLKERNLPLVGALNMYDELEASRSSLDVKELSRRLEMELVPTVARSRKGIDELLRRAIVIADEHHKQPVHTHPHPNQFIDKAHTRTCPCPAYKDEDSQRYAAIHSLLTGIYQRNGGTVTRLTDIIDQLLTNRWLAYPFFFALMWIIFWATFVLGEYPMNLIDEGVSVLGTWLSEHLDEGIVHDLLIDGIIGGVGSVIVFLPNILILYLFISILEDSGYLARAALLADPFLNKTGLHGKSFIPMLMGFGCNVPAIMATRTIENNKSRLLTMLVIPLMSCSARMPVYIVFAGAFFTHQAGTVMFALYVLGIVTALLAAWTMNKLFLRKQENHFVMELPPYRLPSLRGVCSHTWEKGRQYLRKMGGIILFASIIIWALGYFPMNGSSELTPAERQEQSYMGQIGHAMEPALKPLGYDWRMGVGIIAGVGAKELMVSTLGVLYNCSEEDAETTQIETVSQTRLSQALTRHVTPEAALSYLVFALLYFPCLATVIAISGESGSWKWGAFAALYTTCLAYIMAWTVYRIVLIF